VGVEGAADIVAVAVSVAREEVEGGGAVIDLMIL
tara:strand:+ start:285 stop:386 length:102 start_codon:yes stop_codon:yes gene_type:complete